MNTNKFSVALLAFILFSCTESATYVFEKPPVAKIEPIEDIYFGKTIIDPYRYMEDLEDSSVMQWINSQAEYSRKVLNSIPGRRSLLDKMKEFNQRISTEISKLAIADNDRYFYLKQSPEDETGKLFYRDGYEGEEIFLYDPLTYGGDDTRKFVITGMFPSHDGSKVAFGVAEGGVEISTTLIMDVESKALFPESIPNCFSEYAWLPDNASFTYLPYNSADVNDLNRMIDMEAKIHIIGSDPAADRVILSRSMYPDLGIEPSDMPWVEYDKNSGYLFAHVVSLINNKKVFYAPASKIVDETIEWTPLILREDEVYEFIANDREIYLYTHKDAPNFKIIKTSLENPDMNNAAVIVPEDKHRSIKSFALTNNGLYYTLSKNGVEEKLYLLANNADSSVELNLPFSAGVVYLSSKGVRHDDIWVVIAGWTSDYKRYRYLQETNVFQLENFSEGAQYPEYEDLLVEELMVPSHDGVKVPLSLICKKDLVRNGKTPVFLFGYGAYGISMNPFFWPEILLWVYEGGVFAVAHVRGGGELGSEWHQAGQKTNKPNTWKDLIACTEYLIDESYTSPEHIAIFSGSAGGILVGRAMTERPDLYAAVIPDVGVMNTMRLENMVGHEMNIPEFGSIDDSIECMALLEMDSYLHLEHGVRYPATLITAGLNDPRVVASQPAKFAARLLEVNISDHPVLFFADSEKGHGIGDTKTKQFETWADLLSFALWNTGHPDYQLELK